MSVARGATEVFLRARACIAVTALVVAAAMAQPAATAAARKCFGKPATIVSGKATINGTRRDDVIVSTARGATNYIYGKGGNDLICGSSKFDWISGGPGRDKMRGFGDRDFLQGDAGNDVFMGETNDGGAHDTAYFRHSPGPVTVDLPAGRATGEGTDRLSNIESVWGSEFNDTIIGDDAGEHIWAVGGDDNVTGGAETDFIDLGPGNDVGNGGDGTFDVVMFDLFDAGAGVVVDLAGGTANGHGDDQLSGFEAIWGSRYDDELRGNGETNAFLPEQGDDTLDGRSGNDLVVHWLTDSAVTANLQTGQSSSVTDGTDTLIAIEGFAGSNFSDSLTGDDQNNYIDGNDGADILNGAGGNDYFQHYDSAGSDTVDGGPGDYDLWDYVGFESVNANLFTGALTAPPFNVGVTGIEAVGTSDKADVIVGNDANNFLFGYGGDDEISGGAGNDQIDGGTGTDEVDGGPGTDDCVETETPTSCEGNVGPPEHPLLQLVTDVDAFRRSLGRRSLG